MTVRIAVLVALVAGCSIGEPAELDFRACPAVGLDAVAALEPRLSDTGLFDDIGNEELGDGVIPYQPQFVLWSGGAAKRRWVRLPPGGRIDTSDPDAWQFPVGTRFWKEFIRDGVRVETRMLARVGAGADDWAAAAYVWDDDQRDARIAPDGRDHAVGTSHDVPPSSACMGCHRGTQSRVLGFSAIQLSPAGEDSWIDLAGLEAQDLVTDPLPAPVVVPGDALQRRAIGWLHANCGHCHNQNRPAPRALRCYDPQRSFDLSLRVDSLGSLEDTGVYRTAVGTVFEAGLPDDSLAIKRIRGGEMPPLAVEFLDRGALDVLVQWLEAMPPPSAGPEPGPEPER
jgi:hypothetical protein